MVVVTAELNLPSGVVIKLHTGEGITFASVEAEAGVPTVEELKKEGRKLSRLTSSPSLIPIKSPYHLQLRISSVEITGEVVIMTNEININRISSQEEVAIQRQLARAIRGKISTRPMNLKRLLKQTILMRTLKQRKPRVRKTL